MSRISGEKIPECLHDVVFHGPIFKGTRCLGVSVSWSYYQGLRIGIITEQVIRRSILLDTWHLRSTVPINHSVEYFRFKLLLAISKGRAFPEMGHPDSPF